jgi:hypothetical protein
MGTVDQLLDSIELAHAIGSRRSGHYDHDSKRSTGPAPEPIAVAGIATADAVHVVFRRTQDSETGEYLFHAIPE